MVLEATSDYWRHLYCTLRPHLNLMLVNPAHLKSIRGRESDPSHAAFLARAGASGMVRGSFVPEREIREPRDLTRRRTQLITARGMEAQRLEKELQDTGMKLSPVLSDITGASQRALLHALIDGERITSLLAGLAIRRARSKIPALIQALDGTFTEHHAYMRRHYLNEIDHLTAVADQLDTRITSLPARLERNTDAANLDSIPGIGPAAAEIIIAGTGGDMARFATAGHLASWSGVCPGRNESAGVAKSGRTRPGQSNLKRLLGIAAMSVSRSKDGYLSAYHRRIAARRGRQRALVAVTHTLAVAIWHILRNKTRYHDLGADYFTRRDPEHAMRRMTKEANQLGLTVRFEPITTTA